PASARAARTSGSGRRAYAAKAGRSTRIGTRIATTEAASDAMANTRRDRDLPGVLAAAASRRDAPLRPGALLQHVLRRAFAGAPHQARRPRDHEDDRRFWRELGWAGGGARSKSADGPVLYRGRRTRRSPRRHVQET